MAVFITGTDTNVGKTVVSSWLCLHSGFSYFKPIQTGSIDDTDSDTVRTLAGCTIYPEVFLYPEPVSPHLAASLAGDTIDPGTIQLPKTERVIVEGAGGVLVPINDTTLMADLIKQLNIPVIVVARSGLGTINHTLLTLEALRVRDIPILGVIVNGAFNGPNVDAIAHYGNIPVLAQLPFLQQPSMGALKSIPLTDKLLEIFR